MTVDEVRKMRNGVYRIFWTTGGLSVAAKGQGDDGTPWLAPTNWTAPAVPLGDNVACQIREMELITSQDREFGQKHVASRCRDDGSGWVDV